MNPVLAILATLALAAVTFAAGWRIGARRTRLGAARRTMRTLADLEAISQAGHEAAANTHRQTVALHATDGTPIALALTDKALTALGGA